ncbi:hypothetical protein M569_07642 [Genlisea aurea]|uniref:At1g68980-like TPR repeats domain-containing protein n=1 Tax=Genlisea aurea TaxID=192259 RepID=S8CJD1_9LAMI|nr:hypothetical protein M569_07642 [Genlisea aurea]
MRSLFRESKSFYSKLISGWECGFNHSVSTVGLLHLNEKAHGKGFYKELSTASARKKKLCHLKGPSKSTLLGQISTSLKEKKIIEAWETYYALKNIYGYPDKCVLADILTESSYSADSKCLKWACKLILSIANEKPSLLNLEVVYKIALSLARAQLPVSAASVLRVALGKRRLPPTDVLRSMFMHLLKTESGLHLTSNMLDQICWIFQKLNGNKSAQKELTKPDTIIFNLVLDACASFGTPLKGQLIIERMAQLGVIGDVNTAAIVARIYEMNGMRDELRKLNALVDTVCRTSDNLYLQFYDSLLSLHLKFNDVDSASNLLIGLRQNHSLKPRQSCHQQRLKSFTVSIGSENVKTPLKLLFLPHATLKDYVYKVDSMRDLVLCEDGKLVLSKKGLARFIVAYKITGRINELSKHLVAIRGMLITADDTYPFSDIIDALISLGWFETAHDILDDMEFEKFYVDRSCFVSLSAAYRDSKMFKEAKALERKMESIESRTDSCDDAVVSEKRRDSSKRNPYKDLDSSIIQNMEAVVGNDSVVVREYNSSIRFFSKAKMMDDAKRSYLKMRRSNIEPDDSTLFHLIGGYSSAGAYRDVAFLWGEIKRNNRGALLYGREVLESVLMNLLRGGYFERVMEVVGFMRENGMFVDRGMCRAELLKLHGGLYWRAKTSSDGKDETQRRRIEHVMAFRKFVGIG